MQLDYVLPGWHKIDSAGRRGGKSTSCRMQYEKDFWSELSKYCPQRRLEVAVVTYTSVLNRLLGLSEPESLVRYTYAFDSASKSFRELNFIELTRWRGALPGRITELSNRVVSENLKRKGPEMEDGRYPENKKQNQART